MAERLSSSSQYLFDGLLCSPDFCFFSFSPFPPLHIPHSSRTQALCSFPKVRLGASNEWGQEDTQSQFLQAFAFQNIKLFKPLSTSREDTERGPPLWTKHWGAAGEHAGLLHTRWENEVPLGWGRRETICVDLDQGSRSLVFLTECGEMSKL